MRDALTPLISWEAINSFCNSTFTTSLVGALAGAFAGAVAAQNVADKSKRRDELIKEIRNTNTAIALTFSIFNLMFAIKKQCVAALKINYDEEKDRYLNYHAKLNNGQHQNLEPYALKFDLRGMSVTSPPTKVLQDIVFTALSSIGRPVNLVAALEEAVGNLNISITKRNELIALFRTEQFPEGADFEHMYLGVPYRDGHINQEYGDIVAAIASYTDDAIFFSRLLCQDLREHGLKISSNFERLTKDRSPRITEVDFKLDRYDELLPAEEQYATWFTAFKPVQEPKPSRWWKRKIQ